MHVVFIANCLLSTPASTLGRVAKILLHQEFGRRMSLEKSQLETSSTTTIMSVRQAPQYQQSAPERPIDDDSDAEEEVLANDYRAQVGYEDGDAYHLDRSVSMGVETQDLQAQLVAAAQQLEYGASLEVKIASYDQYCNLFHFVLNSDGPVDIEVPSVSAGRNVVARHEN